MKTKKVLIAEHDPYHAELIIDELNTGDIKKEIILMKDGQEIIDYFQEAYIDSNVKMELQIDLIILDLNLPKIHGMDILKFLKNHTKYRSIPIIIFSTRPDSKNISKAYKNGANGYIIKPLSYDEFVDKLRLLRMYWSDTNTLPLQIL